MIIDVGKAMLQKLGYQVVVAKGGEQTLEKLAQNMDQIDIVIPKQAIHLSRRRSMGNDHGWVPPIIV